MNVLLMLAHSIEEHDQLLLLHDLGYTVASIGGYIDPRAPHDPKRPALDIDRVDVVWDAVQATETTPERPDRLWNAKDELPQPVIDWADVIIVHHVEWRWIVNNWPRIRDKRVIWRTVGQSSHENEYRMRPYRAEGLQVVRYSPKERNIPNYVGEDALIRFWKDPDEWQGWTGEDRVVTNVTQNMLERGPWCNVDWYAAATEGLPTRPGGPGSDKLPGGVGELDLDAMKRLLQESRVYLYTGTQPASYTLGLIEAMMTGIPVVSIGPVRMHGLPYGPQMFEAHEIAGVWSNSPDTTRKLLRDYLDDYQLAREHSAVMRRRAVETFGKDVVGRAWRDFLG